MATWRGKTITQEFGVKNSNYRLGYHPGTDLAFADGEYQLAYANGAARFFRDVGDGYGHTGTITLSNGDVIYYAHLRANGHIVASGQEVREGDPVFITGATGWVEGVHAHIEYRLGGDANSPVDIIKKLGEKGGIMKPTREEIIESYQIIVDHDPSEQQIKDQLGQTKLINVVKSLDQEADSYRNIAEIRRRKLVEIASMVGLDPDKDGLDAIVQRVREFIEQAQFEEVSEKLYRKK